MSNNNNNNKCTMTSAHLVSIIFSSLNEFQHDVDVFRNQEAEQVFHG